MKFSHDMDAQINTPPEILVQCRICHDEDRESNMETPCSCCGTLKYAHRQCVQRWCNEKGDTTCEICLQQFRPGYTAPPPHPLFHYGDSPINFGWGIQNDHFMAMFTANNELLEPEWEFSAPSPSSLICFRIIAIIFIVLLVLHHALPIIFVLSGIFSGLQDYSSTVIMLVVLRAIEMLVPINLLVKAIIAIKRLQHQLHTKSIPELNTEIKRRLQQTTLPSSNGEMKFSHDMDAQINTPPEILVQCRICHDEDKESNMETPCSCCGTLKQFRPGYTAPPPPSLFNYGDSPINFGWGIQNDHFMAMFTANNELLEPEWEFSAPSPSSLICFRIIAIIFIVLLVLHHALPIIFVLSGIFSGLQDYSSTVIMLVVLRAIEMLVPINLLVKAIIAIQRLQHQDYHSDMQSHEENDIEQSQLSVIHIH